MQAAACGILMIYAFFKKDYIWDASPSKQDRKWMFAGGMWLVIAGFGYFYFAIHYLLPFFARENWGGALSNEAFGWLGGELSQIIKAIISQPNIIAWEIVSTPSKLIYLTIAFAALAFIPLLKISLLIPIIPLLGIALLSRLTNYYDYNTHYMAGFIAPVIFSFAISISRAEKIWVLLEKNCIDILFHLKIFFSSTHTLINKSLQARNSFIIFLTTWIILGNIILSTSPISRIFWSNKSWSYSWSAYVPNERTSTIKAAILEYIPTDPKVIVTTQNTLNWTHLAQRNTYLSFPMGITEPYQIVSWSSRSIDDFMNFVRTGYRSKNSEIEVFAHFVLIDLKRPYFLVDQGCNWAYGKCQNIKKEKEFLTILESTKALYKIIYEYDGFMILERKSL
ncbi:hypothetical protein PHIN9_03150 [Polynucleobacter sp. HIN9]|nr:hypothetical protein PHIN9_03150 [Polynucleobacter sp. HIN9]